MAGLVAAAIHRVGDEGLHQIHRGYAVHTYIYAKRKMVALTADDIDCIVAYIVPLNLWYVLPVEEFSPCKNLWFYPHGSKKGSRLNPSAKPGGC